MNKPPVNLKLDSILPSRELIIEFIFQVENSSSRVHDSFSSQIKSDSEGMAIIPSARGCCSSSLGGIMIGCISFPRTSWNRLIWVSIVGNDDESYPSGYVPIVFSATYGLSR